MLQACKSLPKLLHNSESARSLLLAESSPSQLGACEAHAKHFAIARIADVVIRCARSLRMRKLRYTSTSCTRENCPSPAVREQQQRLEFP